MSLPTPDPQNPSNIKLFIIIFFKLKSMSDSSNFTLVFYYIPEDYDELSTPNAYAVPKNVNDITLGDIESLFPLTPKNKSGDCPFHFRFKYKYNS